MTEKLQAPEGAPATPVEVDKLVAEWAEAAGMELDYDLARDAGQLVRAALARFASPAPAAAPAVSLSPTASLKWDHDGQGGYFVEMRVNSLRSEDHAHAAMAYMERLFCAGEINVN